jgi:hypothetical protein
VQHPGGGDELLSRTWTISSHPDEESKDRAFSVTVKRAGLVSGWLHSSFRLGDALAWRGVGGEFVVKEHDGLALLIGGGVGEVSRTNMAGLSFLIGLREGAWHGSGSVCHQALEGVQLAGCMDRAAATSWSITKMALRC